VSRLGKWAWPTEPQSPGGAMLLANRTCAGNYASVGRPEAALPFPRIGIVRVAHSARDGADVHVAVIDVPHYWT
jgi:hypothetical protein